MNIKKNWKVKENLGYYLNSTISNKMEINNAKKNKCLDGKY